MVIVIIGWNFGGDIICIILIIMGIVGLKLLER